MAYSLFWNPLVHHSSSWNTPSDIWDTFRAAQYVTWGGESQIYNNPAAFQSFPGIAVLLAPVAKVADVWHLSASFPITLARPTAWLILGPVELALGAILLFPLDKLAQRLDVGVRRRTYLLIVETIVIWPSVAFWDHPEDALSLALGVYAFLAVLDGAWFRAAAFLALALAMQPLIILIVPVVLAYVPVRRWALMLGVMAVPSSVLLLSPLIQEWGPTTRRLLKQPNFPIHNHPTPWMHYAPVISIGHWSDAKFAKYVKLPGGHHQLVEVSSKVFIAPVVAAGPGRLVAVALACVIGLVVKAWKPSLPQVVWMAALALALRCEFESVMVPYYLVPALALSLVVASRGGLVKSSSCAVMVATCTWLSYHFLSPWAYYMAMTCSLGLVMLISWPGSSRTNVPQGTFTG
jgi:hypothetical protein